MSKPNQTHFNFDFRNSYMTCTDLRLFMLSVHVTVSEIKISLKLYLGCYTFEIKKYKDLVLYLYFFLNLVLVDFIERWKYFSFLNYKSFLYRKDYNFEVKIKHK